MLATLQPVFRPDAAAAAGMVGHRLGLLAALCQPRPRPAAPGRTHGRAAAPVRHSGFRSGRTRLGGRSEEHTSELQSLMRISYAVFCLKKKKKQQTKKHITK